MGNCLKSPTSDDISLLHESQSDRASYGDAADPDQEPPPPYQVTLFEQFGPLYDHSYQCFLGTSLSTFIVSFSLDDITCITDVE